MPHNVEGTIYDKLAEKYGMSIEKAKETCRNMAKLGEEEGLAYQFDTLVLANTFDAHRLVMFAKTKGLMQQMTDRLLRAYFTESKHIGDHKTLVDLAADVGLPREEVSQMLATDAMSEEVRADEAAATQYGIGSIPFYLINQKYSITGAQPVDVFVQALQQVLNDENGGT